MPLVAVLERFGMGHSLEAVQLPGVGGPLTGLSIGVRQSGRVAVHLRDSQEAEAIFGSSSQPKNPKVSCGFWHIGWLHSISSTPFRKILPVHYCRSPIDDLRLSARLCSIPPGGALTGDPEEGKNYR